MRTKNLICLLLVVLGIGNLWAQERTHLITLEPGAAIHADFYISEVQDARQIQGNIGVAQIGLANKQVPANFEEDFSVHLQTYLNSILPKKEDAEPLILKVHKLYISERTSAMSELGSCELKVEFIKNEDGKNYSLGTFQATTEGKGMDVTPKHDERIKEAIAKCVQQFKNTNWKNAGTNELIADVANIEVVLPTHLKKGLYFDFEDLLNNTPNQEMKFKTKSIAQSKKMEHFQVFQQDKNKRIKNLFGYSDGQSVYINASRYTQEEYFVKSKFMGRYIYFEDQYSSKAATAALGLLGAAVSTKHTGIVLDTKTGITTVLTNKNMEMILKDYPELLEAYNKSKKTVDDDRRMIEKINSLS